MLKKLKKHLIILNTAMTGIILSIVVASACIMNIRQYKKHILENYSTLLNNIVNKLESDNYISNGWLSELEIEHKLIIHIEDNGTPFFFKGSWKPIVDRNSLIVKAKKAAFAEEIDTNINPLTYEKKYSSIFHMKISRNDTAYASVCIIPMKNGYQSLTLIQFHPAEYLHIIKKIFLYIGIDIVGILGLIFVSYLFVKKVLRPVEENQKRQSEFIAAASHDLRSPLAVIQSTASALLLGETEKKHYVPKIIDECKRMSRLISDMLILASADAKSWHINKQFLDTDTYFIELYESYVALCQKKEQVLKIDFKEDSLPPLYVDKDRLTQVLGILIDNAISYSGQKSTITIRPYTKKNSLVIEVEDHGVGIAQEEKEHVFERFYRTDKSRNDNLHFGLGLSIAKELIELLHGKIYLKDTLRGGTTFIIELPIQAGKTERL